VKGRKQVDWLTLDEAVHLLSYWHIQKKTCKVIQKEIMERGTQRWWKDVH